MADKLPEKNDVLCLLGPTAAGKTGLAVELCQHYPFEIISVDSALVYRRMNIGTAKPDPATLNAAPHALIDLVEPWESYSVSRFLGDVESEIQRIIQHNRIPLLVGGTMMYYHALWFGLSELPESDSNTRVRLQQRADEIGWQNMHERLADIDPVAAKRIHPNDPQRLLRALEVFELSGVPISTLQQRKPPENYRFFNVGIMPADRSLLHKTIAARFEQMLTEGFEREVDGLMNLPEMHVELASMRCVGYRQMWDFLADNCTRKEMIERSLAATRQLAKRQITWMRRMENLHLLDVAPRIDDLRHVAEFNQLIDRHR
ncbi:tRNA (adenosine(37)-N6)-dimethylallyltransferase MiaA [Chromatiales bacterium (ex Bugula neritina AB1)]|nr:tRNA (adenosine(37)-N6)-dimethylallyltransferase MiaA [Chromatiales bacterium (ex Bugula neritina AB1)]